MKIRQISIKNLFNTFNHTIPFKEKENITIIHGPNGFGKTFTFKIINSIFNNKFYELKKNSFSELFIEFTENKTLKVTNSTEKEKYLTFELFENNELLFEPYEMTVEIKNKEINKYLNDYIDKFPELKRERGTWIYKVTNQQLSIDDIISNFGERLAVLFIVKQRPVWLEEIINAINVYFINVNRITSDFTFKKGNEIGTSLEIPAVLKYSQEIIDLIQQKTEEYGIISDKLDRDYPIRVLKGTPFAVSELKNKLKLIEEKRIKLIEIGLLDNLNDDFDFKNIDIDETNIKFLSVYVSDMEQKLGIFDDISKKADLLMKLINKRFLYKKLLVDKKNGFLFKSNEELLNSDKLSSGEQHEFVLFYELIFKVKPNSLILIDEPELSLHVYWQQQFLKDIDDITKIVGFNALIATHSPQIIHNRWDLTVALEGPER